MTSPPFPTPTFARRAQLLCAALVLPALLFTAPAAPAFAQTQAADGGPALEARAAIEQTAAEVIAILANRENSLAQKRRAIEALALERFDFETMSKLVLKRDWRKFNPQQRKEFVVAFRSYLAASYGSRIARYRQESVELTGERLEKRGDVSVETVIRGGEADGVAIVYRLRKGRGDGRWRIIDVVIEGISLVANFRAQFADVLSQGGPKELLRRLKQKNAEAAAADPDAAATVQ